MDNLRKAYQRSNSFTSGIALKLIHIPQVKEEFRILGITSSNELNGFLVIGVVFRGNKELDGVISSRGKSSLEDIISKMLLKSKHNGQVRLILLEENMLPEQVEPEKIWEKTGKPVLVINEETMIDSRYMFQYHDHIVTARGVDEASATRVLDKVYGDSGSEALRIASYILKSILELHNV